jgi:hypothetical protein
MQFAPKRAIAMMKVYALLTVASLLAGCSPGESPGLQQAKAAQVESSNDCKAAPGKSHLEKAKCINDVIRRTTYQYAQYKDLMEQGMAMREALAAKLDRGELTSEEANLQLSTFK